MKWFLTIASLSAFVAAVTLEVLYRGNGFLLAGMVGFVALLIVANLDRVAEVSASKDGFQLRAQAVVERAENAVSEIQLLAKIVADISLSLVMRSGRMGGYSDQEKEQIKKSVFDVLSKIGLAKSEIEATLDDWHQFVEFDYAFCILGGSYAIEGADSTLRQEWKVLRERGLGAVATPDMIRAFLTKYELLSTELEELLTDYEHYRITRFHRRPAVWGDRRNWGRLRKT